MISQSTTRWVKSSYYIAALDTESVAFVRVRVSGGKEEWDGEGEGGLSKDSGTKFYNFGIKHINICPGRMKRRVKNRDKVKAIDKLS